MKWVGVVVAVALMAVVLIDAFEVVLLPRRVQHGFRLSRFFYRISWSIGRTAARLLPPGWGRTEILSAFGPLSLVVLVVLWAVGLIFSFALLHWLLGTALSVTETGFGSYLYFSGTTFFTLGYGDLVPTGAAGRALSVAESGLGFLFLAVIVSYLPVLYQAFSRLETTMAFGCQGRVPAQRRRITAAVGRRPQSLRRRTVPGRMGALGGGPAGDAYLVSGPQLLPLAARKPVVGRHAHGDPRHVIAAAGGRGRAGRLSGAFDVRDGAARRGRPGDGLPNAAVAAAAGPPARGGSGPLAAGARGGRGEDARRAGGSNRAGRVAGPVRAVRQHPGGALPLRDAAFPAGQAAGGQLANQSLDAAFARSGRPSRARNDHFD